MISKCRAWLTRWFDNEKQLQDEKAKTRYFIMLYENALEDSLNLSVRNAQLRRQVQELESRTAKPDTRSYGTIGGQHA